MSDRMSDIGAMAAGILRLLDRRAASGDGASPSAPDHEGVLRSLGRTLNALLHGRDPGRGVHAGFTCTRIGHEFEVRCRGRLLPVDSYRPRAALAESGLLLKDGESLLLDAELARKWIRLDLASADDLCREMRRESANASAHALGDIGPFSPFFLHVADLNRRRRLLKTALFVADRMLQRRERSRKAGRSRAGKAA